MGYIAKVGDVVKYGLETYTITKEINKGGFADAYKAKDRNGKDVFLKQYKSPSVLVPWFKPYFTYEAELNRRLREDPILSSATVYSNDLFMARVYKEDGYTPWTRNECLFQVFPFITGNTNLGDMIKKGKWAFNWERRLYACTVFAFALRKLHDANIVHCDLKPENVQIKVDDTIAVKYRPLLVDMDWSILSDKKAPWHGKQGYVGTPGYSSPEHLTNLAPLEASDVFTAAIIICEVMADRHPFGSKLGQDDFNEYVLSGKCDFADAAAIPFMEEVTPRFRELIFRALNVDPELRPTMADIHAEFMAMCKAMNKPRIPGIIDTVKNIFGRKIIPTRGTLTPDPPPPPPKPAVKPYKDASMVKIAPKTSAKALTLIGDLGKFTTKTSFVLDQAILKRLSKDAKYADSVEQFRIVAGRLSWKIKPNCGAANDTCLNDSVLEDESGETLADNDVISLRGKASGKTAMPLTVKIGD